MKNEWSKIIKKADVLIEALPYIKTFHGKTLVIKYGGSALANEHIRGRLLEDVVFMSYVGLKPVVIHGGGPFIDQRLKERGKPISFVGGLRVTDDETLEVVREVLSTLNRTIVAQIASLGGKAKSLNSWHDGLIKVKPHLCSKRLGRVGKIASVNPSPIKRLLDSNTIPVISPLGVGRGGECYNVNADEVSAHIARSLKAEKLILITDVKGIMRKIDDHASLISTLTIKEAEGLIKKSVVQKGMIPKVKACRAALIGGTKKTHIIDGKIPHALLLEIFTDRGIGTEIIK